MSSASNDPAAAVPWADLPPELCGLVVDRLDAVSVLRFPAACMSWAAVCKETPRLRSVALALLTSAVDYDGYDTEYYVEAGTFGLHDVSTGRSFPGEAAEGLSGRCWIGGKDDWLVTADPKCDLEFFNPVTGARVLLPSFTTIRGIEETKDDDLVLHVVIKDRLQYLQRVALCRTPVHPEGYLAVALFSSGSDSGWLAFTAAKFEGGCWKVLENPAGGKFSDAIVHKGKVFAVDQYGGNIFSRDMDNDNASSDPTMVAVGPKIPISCRLKRGFRLAPPVGGGDGELLLICVYGGQT